MRNLKFTIQFDGTAYHGWQVQDNALAVQEVMCRAAEKVLGEKTGVTGCSRTDSGVHALMYCCTVRTEKTISCGDFANAMNVNLPYDIGVINCEEVSEDFHPRYSCKSKQYVYQIYNSRKKDPFLWKYTYQYTFPLDEKLLSEQAEGFLGTHDFKAFCSSKTTVPDTVRTITKARVERNGDIVSFIFEGDGFLYNMVRIMVGTLLFINTGNIAKGSIPDIILSKDRNKAGITAPAKGLFLTKVEYGDTDG